MPVVTTLTEADVKTYMANMMGDTAIKLSWSVVGGDFDEPTNEVLYSLGKADFSFVSTQSDVQKVRAVARVEAWRAAMFYSAHETTHATGAPGTGQTSRSAVYTHCKEMFQAALSNYTALFPDERPASLVERYSVSYDGDYYANAED